MLLSLLFLFAAGIRQPIAAAQTAIMEGEGCSPWISGEDLAKEKSKNSLEKTYSKDLNKKAKKFYKAAYKHRKSKKRFRVNQKISLKVSRSSFRSGKMWKSKKMKAYDRSIGKATDALIASNIDSYWIKYYTWRYYYRYRWTSRNKVSVRIYCVKLKPVERYKGAKKELSAVKKAAKRIAAKIKKTRPDKSRFTTARLIFEYLIKTVSYGSNHGVQYSPASALLSKYKRISVCDGYARAFKMICDYCGVPCLYVSSSPAEHAWNMVKLENGKWYGVDVTWGDDGSTADYYWFMYGKNDAVSGDHAVKAINGPKDNYYQFSLPALSSTGKRYNG